MRWLRRIALALVLLLAVSLLVLAVGSQVGLDRERRHSAATAALPLGAGTSPDGLVRIPAGGFEFRARVAGLGNPGTPVVLLHGFPETSIMWERLIAATAADGHRTVAFDQRGYSPGARPESVDANLTYAAKGALPEPAMTLLRDAFGVADPDANAVIRFASAEAGLPSPAAMLSDASRAAWAIMKPPATKPNIRR